VPGGILSPEWQAPDDDGMTMRWHSNTDIISIEEANLISARRHGVDLDLPTLWHTLLGTDGLASQQQSKAGAAIRGAAIRYDLVSRTELLKNRLRSVIVHAWPRPRDPVVAALRGEALEMMDELEKLRQRILNCAKLS
jgi:hypothetical protein